LADDHMKINRRRLSMKLSVMYELFTPQPMDVDAEHRIIQQTLDQIELADKLGFRAAWAVEHHFLEEYAHSSAPEVLLAAASQRTTRIRLGHGIVNTVPAINHPFRVAERISTLDHVSKGRVEFGSGEGASAVELGGFGVDPDQKNAMWEEGLDFVLKAMTERPFAGYSGQFVSAPIRNVVPKPYQQPHPPLWMATSRREKIVAAARKGMGALGFYFVDPQIAVEWVHHYYEVFEREAVAVGFAANPSIALNIGMHAAPTRKQAVEQYQDAFDLFGSQTVHYYRDGEHVPGVTSPTEVFEAQKAANGAPVQVKWDDKEPAGIGTVDNIMALCEIYEDASLDELLIMPQMASNVTHEDAMASLELIGTQVIPELHGRHEATESARQKWKAELAEKAVARRTEAPRKAEPDYRVNPIATGISETIADLAAGRERRVRDIVEGAGR
jgi:alkanesulfonate monooxygenase SsuD/methylene tetrahydromethanopterin reductase-like flavin-dependent oxidoreductase (luciferase family)